MAENPEGVIMPTGAAPSLAQGDVPEAVRRRYLTEGRGAQLAYFTDRTVKQPAFHDVGRRLMTDRATPAVIMDMLAIAEHRGWSQVQVRGSVEFRREVWWLAQARGIEVNGYQPTGREQQAQERLTGAPARDVPAQPAAKSAPDQDRGLTGKLIEVGAAPYKHRPDAEDSPFIKLKPTSGRVQTLWGVGLPGALAKAGVQIGDNVTVRRTGVEQVVKAVRETDRETGVVQVQRRTVPRNQWEVVAERFRGATPEQAARDPQLRGAQSRMAAIETVVRSRAEPAAAERIIGAARERIASWLMRGARFESAPALERAVDQRRERRR